METSLSPTLTLLFAIVVLIALALLICGVRLEKWRRLALVTIGVLLLVPSAFLVAALNPWLTDPRFNTYRTFYRDIEVGMTRADVLDLIDHHYPASGKRQRPDVMDDTSTHLGFFMNPEHSQEPNCEGIFLSLLDGRVVNKSYSPD